MKRRTRWLLLPIAMLALIWASFSQPTYAPPAAANVRLRLNYLERVIRAGAAPRTALGALTQQNPEWGLFTLSFTSYALANLARHDPSLRPEAARYIGLAIRQVLAKPIRQAFAAGWPAPAEGGDSLPPSVLYLGHLNLLLGCHRQLVPNSPYCRLHDALSATLYRRYGQEPAGNLASYPTCAGCPTIPWPWPRWRCTAASRAAPTRRRASAGWPPRAASGSTPKPGC